MTEVMPSPADPFSATSKTAIDSADVDAQAGKMAPRLPAKLAEAMWRGGRGRCPRCEESKLFRAFLKPVDRCSSCGQDWTHHQADDFPAYVSIFLSGHILAPVVTALARDTDLSAGAIAAILIPLVLALTLIFLQPAKGAIIALQWWFGMHGFIKERPATEVCDHPA